MGQQAGFVGRLLRAAAGRPVQEPPSRLIGGVAPPGLMGEALIRVKKACSRFFDVRREVISKIFEFGHCLKTGAGDFLHFDQPKAAVSQQSIKVQEVQPQLHVTHQFASESYIIYICQKFLKIY